MPNPIKYSTGSETNALKKGNFYIGTGSEGKGPSDVTGYYNGVTPQTGGYVIYMFKDGAPGNLSYHSAANDSELISFTSGLAEQTYTGVSQCFDYYAGQTDKVMIIQEFPSDYPLNYPNIVMPGLVLNLDAGITQSYPGSGTTWTDINGLGPNNNGTLTNGPTFNSDNGGSIVFDGVDDFVSGSDTPFRFTNTFTLESTVYFNGNNIDGTMIGKRNGSPFNQYALSIYSGNPYVGGPGKVVTLFLRPDGSSYDTILNYTLSSAGIYNIVATIDSQSQILYINGTAVTNSTNNYSGFTFNIPGRDVLIGATRNNAGTGIFSPYSGNIYSAKIYNRALSASEVLQNFNAQKGRFGL
jgi:hypothetical protein